MGSYDRQLEVFFFPFMSHGHIIPTLDMAKLFASRSIKASIITTPVNVPQFSSTIEKAKSQLGLEIHIKVIKFPTVEAGLPEGCENLDILTSFKNGMELMDKFMLASAMLQEPMEKLLQETRPDCLVADMFFPWATEAASKFGIPRLVFHGKSFFALCIEECLRVYQPQRSVSSDSEPFTIPNLPGDIKLTRKQLPGFNKEEKETDISRNIKAFKESEVKSFGVLVNSFYELESSYADFYRSVLGRRAWHVGPTSLSARGLEKQAAVTRDECLKWLDTKEHGSVVYVCFGTLSKFNSSQLKEIAIGLEASEKEFIWVVRREKKSETDIEEDDWLPEGFEERMKDKGLIVRGWAPQVLILEHEAIGGFVTHCGWNSILEGISTGKPMVTWPLFAEQFYNEKLVTDVLKIGVSVGVQEWNMFFGDFVKSDAIDKAIRRIMVDLEAEQMRIRAKKLGEMASKAIEVEGSSYSDFNALIDELVRYPR